MYPHNFVVIKCISYISVPWFIYVLVSEYLWMSSRVMSHCGRNSLIMGITMGVPIGVWPIHTNQPINGFLVTDILKVGLLVRDWGKREEVVSASTIQNVVRKLMASEEGDTIRKRAEELGEAVRQSTEKGGAFQIELDSFIAHITR